MTKPVTSVAVLTLLEQGRLRLGDPVSRYLPELAALRVAERAQGRVVASEPLRSVPVRREMTVQDLLRQTSGLTSASFAGGGPIEELYRRAAIFDPAGTLADAVRRLGKLPLKYEPGSAWEYGVSLDVAARLVEVVSGMPYDEYLARHIFEPLGMKDTGHFVESKHHDRLAQLYDTDPERDHALVPADSERARGVLARPTLLRGASGLVSTAEDYARFAQMLLAGGVLEGRRVLGRKTVELMTSDHLGDIGIKADANLASTALAESTRGYGYGLAVGVRTSRGVSTRPGSIGDLYWDGAANTLFWVDPKEDLVAVFMIQLMDYFRGRDLQDQFRALVYAAIDD
jgi:CubicO group peptidase (beta-lactamase class C family)